MRLIIEANNGMDAIRLSPFKIGEPFRCKSLICTEITSERIPPSLLDRIFKKPGMFLVTPVFKDARIAKKLGKTLDPMPEYLL